MNVANGAQPSNVEKETKTLLPFTGVWKRDSGDNFEDDYYYRITNSTSSELVLDMFTTQNGDPLDVDTNTNDSTIQKNIQKLKLPPKSVKAFRGTVLNAIGRRIIMEKVYAGELSFQPLNIKLNTDYRIFNRTARRLGIQNYDEDKGDLVIPPFGTRSVNSDLLRWYNFLEWERQDLIQVMPEEQATKGPGSISTFWDWMKLLPGLLLVALTGFGIPLWVVDHFGGGEMLLKAFATGDMFSSNPQSLPLMGLGRLFQAGFICVATILPALFYYLFGRQQVEKLRQRFFHDVLVLDPHIYTLSEAESKYDTLLSSAYGSSSSNSPFTILLLMFSTAMLAVGWTLTIAPYGSSPDSPGSVIDFFLIKSSPLTLGFLGAYFFSLNMIFRRYVRADLTPKTYAYITVRMLVTFVLVWSIDALPEFSKSPIMQNGLLPLAFIIGVFPEDGFRVIRDSARKIIKGLRAVGDERYPLTALEGLNQYDQARLLEEGIENIENLAHHNLIELLAYTRIPTARLVDMFDQAILYLHLGLFDEPEGQAATQTTNQSEAEHGDPQPETTPRYEGPQKGRLMSGTELLKYLKSFGIRTATDLAKLIDSRADPKISEVIPEEMTIAQLRTVRVTFGDDEWLSYIMNWRKESSKDAVIRASFVRDPYKFYETGEPNRTSEKSKDALTEGSDATPDTKAMTTQPATT
jgi:hypothetical protein